MGYVTESEGHDIRKAVAMHYWNNVLANVVPFMVNGGGELSFLSKGKTPSKSLAGLGVTLGFALPL